MKRGAAIAVTLLSAVGWVLACYLMLQSFAYYSLRPFHMSLAYTWQFLLPIPTLGALALLTLPPLLRRRDGIALAWASAFLVALPIYVGEASVIF